LRLMANVSLVYALLALVFVFSSRRRHTRSKRDWSQTCALPILRSSRWTVGRPIGIGWLRRVNPPVRFCGHGGCKRPAPQEITLCLSLRARGSSAVSHWNAGSLALLSITACCRPECCVQTTQTLLRRPAGSHA